MRSIHDQEMWREGYASTTTVLHAAYLQHHGGRNINSVFSVHTVVHTTATAAAATPCGSLVPVPPRVKVRAALACQKRGDDRRI